MHARNTLRARRRNYHEILSKFLETGKKYQTLELFGESARAVKNQLDTLISSKGWRNRIMVLASDGSITLVNMEKFSLYRLKRGPRRT